MKIKLFIVFMLTYLSSFSQRIAISCDGNIHDVDDICSVSMELGMLAKSNMQSQVTYFGYSDHWWTTTASQQTQEANSVINSANAWGGFDMSKFIDVQKNHAAAIAMLVAEINKSTSANLLTIAALGPMQAVGEAIAASDPTKRQFVTVVSHSDWNNTHAGNTGASEGLKLPRYNLDPVNNTGSGTTFISNLGVHITKIRDQNSTVSAPYSAYTWLQTASDSKLNLMWTECRTVANKSNFDCSDAGVVWFILKNDQNGTPAKLQAFFTGDVVVTPPPVVQPSTGVYYISTTDGNDANSGTSPTTAWKTLAKLNASWGSLQSATQILLKRGDVFTGSITAGKSGVTLGAYGSGAKPIITVLQTVGGWTSIGNGVYESATTTPVDLMTVLIDGKTYGQGRSPDAGSYYTATNHTTGTTTTTVTGSGMPSTNWTGATLVGRTRHWIMERFKITGQSGNTITYTDGTASAPRNIDIGNGFFIMNDPKTLNQFGEWYRNPSTGKLSMFFGSTLPSNYTVQMSTTNNIISVNSKTNVIIKSLSLVGANGDAVSLISGSGASVLDCDIDASGRDGILIANHSSPTVSGSRITRSLNNGIEGNHFTNGANMTITNNYVDYTYYIEGMGGNSQQDGTGISIFNTGLVEGNTVLHSGYVGIFFWWLATTIKNNYIDNYCFIKDDGGGIYCGGNRGKPAGTKKTVIGNIILHGIGATQGTAPSGSEAEGIYLDDEASTIDVINNTVAYGTGKGLYIHNANGITVTGNTFFNNSTGMYYKVNGAGYTISGLRVTGNTSFSLTSSQRTVFLANLNGSASTFGVIDNNYYCKPISENLASTLAQARHLTWRESIGEFMVTLSGWKSKFPNYDVNTNGSPIPITNTNQVLFQYNPTGTGATVDLGTSKYVDVTGTAYQGQFQLSPYSSKVLLLTSGSPVTPPPIDPPGPGPVVNPPPVTPPVTPPSTSPDIKLKVRRKIINVQ